MSLLQRLGLPLQTELLILTLLGMANSTLDWKPFELMVRLDLIRDMSFENIRIGAKFASSVKKLLATTVAVEFFCSLLNPLAHILKLYPIVTMSRSDFLLPWLVIHAVSCVLPKILSFGLVCAFYSKNVASTLFLLEFLFVESINVLIAGYNWYIFFDFYLSLRELEEQRDAPKARAGDSCTRSRPCPGLPSASASASESSASSSESVELRVFAAGGSDLDGDSVSSSKPEEASRGKIEAPQLSSAGAAEPIALGVEERPESRDVLDDVSNRCTCSSSEDEEEIRGFRSEPKKKIKAIRTNENFRGKGQLNEKTKFKIKQLGKSSREPSLSASRAVTDTNFGQKNDKLHFRLDKNFQLLNRMFRAVSANSESASKSSNQKWLIFRHELESTLVGNGLLKESNSFVAISDLKNDCQGLKPNHVESGAKDEEKQRAKGASKSELDGQCKETSCESAPPDASKATEPGPTRHKHLIQSHPVFTRVSHDDCFKPHKSNNTVLKPSTTAKWPRSSENKRARELRNLQAYNDLTLESDRREMLRKRSRSIAADEKVETTHECDQEPGTPRRMRQTIENIDWSSSSSSSRQSAASPATSAKARVASRSEGWGGGQDSRARRVLADDETVALLRNAFSFGDESERGFRLGPGASEPYPVFQVVALGVAEVFKSTGWRGFEQALPCLGAGGDHEHRVRDCRQGDHEEIEIPSMDSSGRVLEKVPSGDVDSAAGASAGAGDDPSHELEQQKNASASLLDQLQALMESSRETLSALEAARFADTLEYLSVLGDFCGPGSRLDTYVCAVDGDESDSRSRKPKASSDAGPATPAMHRSRRGEEGLSSGNVMEFDSEGRVLSATESRDGPLDQSSAGSAGSDERLVELFDGVYKGIADDADQAKARRRIERLATAENFSKFMSFFEGSEQARRDAREVELNNSDLEDNARTDCSAAANHKSYDIEKAQNCADVSHFEEATSSRDANFAGSHPRESLENYRQQLESGVIKQRIANWSRDSVESLDAFGLERTRKSAQGNAISFSDESDMEEFPAD